MLADPANSVDALRMLCIADTTPVDEETGRARGFLAGVAHFSANFKSRRNEVKAAADWHRAKLRTLADCALANGTALTACVGLTVILEGDRKDAVGNSLEGGAPFGALTSFGTGERLWTSTASVGEYLAKRGVEVYDMTIKDGPKSVEDFLGTSKRFDLIPPCTIMVASNGYKAPPKRAHMRMGQFQTAGDSGRAKPRLFWESLLVTAFRDHGGDVFFEGYEKHSVYWWDRNKMRPYRDTQRSSPGWALREHGPGGVRYADGAGAVAVTAVDYEVVGDTVSVPALGWEGPLRQPSERMLGQVAPDVHGRHHGNGPWSGHEIERAGDVFLGYDPTATEEEFKAAEGVLLDTIPSMRPESAPQVMAPRPFQLPGGEVPWPGGDEKQDRNFRPGQVGAFLAAYPEANALPSDDEKEEEESVD